MKIDTNKDGYDELQILAADARASRRRSNLMTSGMIAGAMVAASAYVSTTNDQVDQIAEESKDLRAMVEQFKWERDERVLQIEQLQREKEFYKENTESLRQAVPELKLGDALAKLSLDIPDTTRPQITKETNLTNIVWMVDGSRRFPLASGDILWVPEGDFSIRYESNTPDGERHKLTRCEGRSACTADTGQAVTPLPLAPAQPYPIKVPARGSSNCIKITLHEKSIRPGFTNGNYVDIEVFYTNDPSCPERR